ncbi:Coenzyme F420 hydrogenase/dehydrogenase, beta subunit C-terminal domain [Anaerostipes butyraticus]|uniref:F420H(2):quinone oxidoreductase n=1 Tax=Anaerostipes butyraticus TaxID=645466 RepID=A0A916QCW2_9FIRM|nr:Coenzyme F420 hydrogenase/dehydrogenase, beta subunit C-terminal domain [Anaerostipes butyraticus]GFO86204.1 F420H(2):quinone oxidoreductase [Anaerostipes butyraticus]
MFTVPFNCTGCHACVNICPKNCISMEDNGEEFLYPLIDMDKCIDCGQCESVCPVINEPELSRQTLAFAIKSRNDSERNKSTSGGIFPIFAKYILNQGGIVLGAAYDENFVVYHTFVENKEQLCLLQGAKYSQSKLDDLFLKIKEILQTGRKVLFSGTPCQCTGLKKYLGKEYDDLVTTDLICHGVPSPKVWQAYIDYRSQKENSGQRPTQINMRSKESGWSRYGYSTEFVYSPDHITRTKNGQDLFMKAFIGNICLRNSCSDCKAKGVERCTDFTLGDYWGIWNQHPEFDDNKGTSVVFVHTEKGRQILNELQDQIDSLQVSLEDAYKENVSMVNSSKPHEARDEFIKQVTADDFEELVNQYFPTVEVKKPRVMQRLKEKIRRILLFNIGRLI